MPHSAKPSARRYSLPMNCLACRRSSKSLRPIVVYWMYLTGAAGAAILNRWKSKSQGPRPMKDDINHWLKQRNKLGLNQTDFWSKVGVTQSGGSRYESGRTIPRPVCHLLMIAYGTQAESDRTVRRLRANHQE